jgi:hypothetical protein
MPAGWQREETGMQDPPMARKETAAAERSWPPPQREWTYEDWLKLPDDGCRYEAVDGVLDVSPPPSIRHQRRSLRIVDRLLSFLKQHPLGEVFYAPVGVCLPNQPVRAARHRLRPRRTAPHHPGARHRGRPRPDRRGPVARQLALRPPRQAAGVSGGRRARVLDRRSPGRGRRGGRPGVGELPAGRPVRPGRRRHLPGPAGIQVPVEAIFA